MELAPGTLEAFVLYLVRASAMVITVPLLGLGSQFSGYKVALIGSLALVMYGVSGSPLPDLGGIELGVLGLRELLIGLFLSFVLHLVMLGVRVAGEMIGHEMGFMVARQVDPATGISTPLITSVYETFFLLGLLAVNGHHWLLQALNRSFERAPVGRLEVGEGFAPMAMRLFGEMFEAGLVFAAPVMVLLFLVSTMIGLLSRAVPHLNILEIGFSLRIILALSSMFLFAPMLAPAMTSVYGAFDRWLDRALVSIGG